MSIIQRIMQILNDKNLRMKDFCTYLDINQSTFTTWKTRDSDPPAKHFILICEFLNISLEYLLTGEETKKTLPSSLKDDESELLEVYSELDNEGKSIVKAACYKERRRMKDEQAATIETEKSVG